MRNRELLIGIVGAVIAGLGAILISSLPTKWAVAVIMAVVLVGILIVVRNAERALLFVVALIIPFHIGSGIPPFLTILHHIGPWDSIDIQFIDILVLALIMNRLVRWVTQRVNFQFYPHTSLPALAWIIAGGLSAIGTAQVDASLIALFQMVKLLLLYLIVANSIEDEENVKWIIIGLLLDIFVQGLLGSYQWIAGHPMGLAFLGEPSELVDGRGMGTIGHPNGYGMWIAATLPLALALLFLEMRQVYKTLVAVVLFVGFFGLVFSLSRGAWLGFVVASISVLIFAIRRRRQNLQIALLGGISLIFFLLIIGISQRGLIIARLTDPAAQESALSRVTLNEGAIEMIKAYPILGVGVNNYSLLMPIYDAYDFTYQGKIVIVHNIYLLVAAETGIIGLAAFLWLLFSLFIQAVRLAGPEREDIAWLVGVGAFSAFTVLAVHGMVDYDLLSNLTIFGVFWLFAAMVSSLSAPAKASREAKNQ
jgi:putative inorganic carbon (HCO3(-)) transporter